MQRHLQRDQMLLESFASSKDCTATDSWPGCTKHKMGGR